MVSTTPMQSHMGAGPLSHELQLMDMPAGYGMAHHAPAESSQWCLPYSSYRAQEAVTPSFMPPLGCSTQPKAVYPHI